MRSLAKYRTVRIALLAATLAAGFHARSAMAEDAAPAPGRAPAASGQPTPGSAAAPSDASVPALTAPSDSPTADKGAPPGTKPAADSLPKDILHLVEQLPPSAYPSPPGRVRGIYGGSLWADLQGLQWPYYPKTGIGVSGSGWVDTGYRNFDAGQGLGTGETKGEQFVQQSRFVLRTTPTWTDSNGAFFVQLQTELVAAKLDTSKGFVWSADDAWIRFGKWKLFDVLVGRFQAWEVYHYGMGLDLFTLERAGANEVNPTPQIYGLTDMYLRQDLVGQGAVHLYPTDWLRFEVGFQYGADNTGDNVDGARPVGIVEWGPLRFKAGAEFLESRGGSQSSSKAQQSRTQGYGAALQLILDPYLELGVNGAYALNDNISKGQLDVQHTDDTYSVGGFANARIIPDLLVGAGLNYTYLVDQNYSPAVGRNDHYDQWQPFGAVQYLLLKQLFIKAVFAYAKADLDPIPTLSQPAKNEMYSTRLRLTYLF
jgi:hypothetical protein